MKKIIIFNSSSSLYGSERGLISIIKSLHDDYDITVVLPSCGPLVKKIQNYNIRVIIFPLSIMAFSFSPLYYLVYFVKFLIDIIYFYFYIYAKQFDLVYTNNSLIVFPSLLARLLRKKHIWHIREFFHVEFVNRIIAKIALAFSSLIICQSENIKKVLFPNGNYKIKVIYEGVDLADYKMGNNLAARKKFSLPDEAVIISLISRVHPLKGQYEFIKLIPDIIKGMNRKVLFLIVGDTTFKNFRENCYKNKIKKFVNDNQLQENVLFLGLIEDIAEILTLTDVSVVTSMRNEPFGIALLESLVFVNTVYANFNPGFREIDYFFNKCKEVSTESIRQSIKTIKNNTQTINLPEIFCFDRYRSQLNLAVQNVVKGCHE